MDKSKKQDCLYYKTSSQVLAAMPVNIERMYVGKDKLCGSINIANDEKNIGDVQYAVCEKSGIKYIKFEGLSSHVEGKGVGTKLILELIKLSKEMGCEGRLTTQASPYTSHNNPAGENKRPLTNMEFYYKLGFIADDEAKDNEIKSYIDKGERVPLILNMFTGISLSKEAAEELVIKQQKLKDAYETQQNILALKSQNKALNKI
jgi:GNAT superfamily N-acetyltransferase